VAVLNETAGRRLFGDRDPVGAQIAFWGARRTIVGIVRDERIHGLTADAPIAVYVPLDQAPSANGAGVLLLRGTGDPLMLSAAARRAIRELDPELAVFGVEPLSETLSQSIGQQRFMMWLLATFAGLALVLAAVGVHGVLSYSVVQRTREIGIRLALGAEPQEVRRRIVWQGTVMALAGIAVGLVGAVLLSRALRSLLYGVSPGDPFTLAGVAVLLVAVALVASAAPSYRATRIDPTAAMRAEP
jgi:predicted lysophospholipase L1 biosynthesis ABC-type transport system permease subunit